MRKILQGAASALVVCGMVFGSSAMASAEEVPPEETPVVEVVETPIAEEVPAPVVEQTPVVVETVPPVTEPAAPVEEVVPEVAPAPVEELKTATVKEETKTIKWILPNGGTDTNVTWDQPEATTANLGLVPCGTTVWLQVDTYPYTTDQDKARTDALNDDGVLTFGEDHGWAKSWIFETYTAPACAPVIKEIPYPTLLANEICGATNDTVYVDPTWIEQYGSLVNGPWIDTKYKNQNGKWVVDGSAQIKAELRSTYIWAGTAGTDKSSFLRWQMYPGTAPFVHEDVNTECPPLPANPTAELTATCGAAELVLTNPLINDASQLTASFVVMVDGEFYDAYSVESGARVEDSFEFAEDSGDHLIEVYQAGTSEWKLIAETTVTSDCELPPTEEPPTEEPPVVTPPVVNPPVVNEPVAAPAPVVAGNVSTDTLAQTGLEGNPLWSVLGGAGAVMLGLALFFSSLLRKRSAVEVSE